MTEHPSSHYPFVPLPARGPLHFPHAARIALIITLNLEYWELERPAQKEPMFSGGPATIPHALPGDTWDTANWTWREYGQRIGVWRVLRALDDLGLAASCTCNGLTITERPQIIDAIKERGWELVPHNWAQNDLLSYHAHHPADERAIIRKTLDAYENAVGRPAKAWLSSAIRGTHRTPAFLKEFGLIAYSDYLNDDQPYMIETTYGPIVAIPYSNDVNDFNMFARGSSSTRDGVETLKTCFDQLYEEGSETGRIMNFGLHPHVIGQPHRIAALKEFLSYVKSVPNVWLPTREELASWYMTVHETHIGRAG